MAAMFLSKNLDRFCSVTPEPINIGGSPVSRPVMMIPSVRKNLAALAVSIRICIPHGISRGIIRRNSVHILVIQAVISGPESSDCTYGISNIFSTKIPLIPLRMYIRASLQA
ncbi:hypothetical protein DERP_003466 [Dermatophagoides pteronyssinus]|uniref:Uncharacterized protein n=1 Tax=Dermatophagoides pteronyssinus TaxID=6956 RepID=A0ABQ8JKQ0_DERPT|nr:hypothetical protein DERP_003466 [Dermatophagoides pteronyssinus]